MCTDKNTPEFAGQAVATEFERLHEEGRLAPMQHAYVDGNRYLRLYNLSDERLSIEVRQTDGRAVPRSVAAANPSRGALWDDSALFIVQPGWICHVVAAQTNALVGEFVTTDDER